MMMGTNELQITIPCASKHCWLRSLWHMHGTQKWRCIEKVCEQVNKVPWNLVWNADYGREPCLHGTDDPSVAATHAPRMSTHQTAFEQTIDDIMSMCTEAGSSRRILYVETWYLHVQHHHVCIRSRKIRIQPDMLGNRFLQACQEAWVDIAVEGEWQIELVKHKPVSFASTIAHVILTQGNTVGIHTAIFRSEHFPVLQRNRAILYPIHSETVRLFQIAQYRTACIRDDAVCCASWAEGALDKQVCQGERIDAESAAFIQGEIRIEEPSSDEEDTESNSTTTAGGTSPEEGQDSDFDSFMSILSNPHMQDAGQVPNYPWLNPDDGQHLDDHDFQDEDDDDICYAEGQEEVIRQHLSEDFDFSNERRQWHIITYGLGVADLGRRDTTLYPGTEHELLERIHNLWEDHARFGTMKVWYVQPQPRLRPTPNIVLLVDMGVAGTGEEDRCVLVSEVAPDMVPHRTEHYAAWIYSGTSALGIMIGLGHHCCYPMGIHDCHVNLRGQQLARGTFHFAIDGSYVQIQIEAYPEHVATASRLLDNAERFYINARAAHEQQDHLSSKVIIRTHGISPANKPLGFRDMIVNFDTLGGHGWLHQVCSLWPFEPSHRPQIVFIEGTTETERDETGAIIFHFVISYVGRRAGMPILIKQTMHTDVEGIRHSELWAKWVDSDSAGDEGRIRAQLTQPPFWSDTGPRCTLLRDGYPYHEIIRPWMLGDRMEISVRIRNREELLHRLLTFGSQDDCYQEDPEAVAFLQIHAAAINEDQWNDGVTKEQSNELDNDTRTCIQELQCIVANLQESNWIGLNTDFTELPHIHPAAQCAIATTAQYDTTSTIFHIYTDGSCKHQASAWAFVVLCEWNDERTMQKRFARVGFSGAQLDGEIGPFEHTSADAESTAIIAAAEFLLSRQDKQKLHIHLHFDSTSAGFSAVGEYNLPSNQHTATFRQYGARILLSLLQRTCKSFAGFHVHAHEGQPYNEFVDSVASACRQGWICAEQPQLKSGALLKHEYKEWAWLEMAPDEFLPGIENILKNETPSPYTGQGDHLFAQLEADASTRANSAHSCQTCLSQCWDYGLYRTRSSTCNQPQVTRTDGTIQQ